ncbi:hypothetical protein BOTBODRAFT_603054 [Botryobasidium botryosum FD-172 SS1]|uniref:Uncharacterized protein n=1 Tax=Botryobasidium botryosum (strain FD-172 SS1) TaxID=930990 RepID=A0A067MNL5_BOTB1|nr:hypothetical protein BOTBODRAFT_603054 [Botryobasidium botryosum FD-172 SS1]
MKQKCCQQSPAAKWARSPRVACPRASESAIYVRTRLQLQNARDPSELRLPATARGRRSRLPRALELVDEARTGGLSGVGLARSHGRGLLRNIERTRLARGRGRTRTRTRVDSGETRRSRGSGRTGTRTGETGEGSECLPLAGVCVVDGALDSGACGRDAGSGGARGSARNGTGPRFFDGTRDGEDVGGGRER